MTVVSRGKLRRIAHLEARVDRLFQSEQLAQAEYKKRVRDGSFLIIANVCLIALYGTPRIDESLMEAWKRSLKTLLRKFPGFAKNGRATPFNFQAAAVIARDFHKYVLPRLPGADDNDKIFPVLADAPQWLLWHTHADESCAPCGIDVPDVSNMQRFARDLWFLGILPPGPFELRVPRADATKPAKGPEYRAPMPPPPKTTHEGLSAFRVRVIRNILVADFQEKAAEALNNGSLRERPLRFPPLLDLKLTNLHPQALDPFD
jgi:hypothetical protein